ncbi:MAG: GDSL-type esterase/lipase family protein [Planctomycetota bacterium]
MAHKLALFLTSLCFAAPAFSQRVACIGPPFANGAIADARQSFEAALQWRLSAEHTVRCFASHDESAETWHPHVLVSAGRDKVPPKLAAGFTGRWVDVTERLSEQRLAAERPTDPFVADRLAAVVAEALTGVRPRVTTTPLPSPEHRAAAAGWGRGSWWDQHQGLTDFAVRNRDLEILFLGDSITQSLTGVHDRRARADGSRAFDRHFGKVAAAAFGIAGDRTQHVLFRLRQGEIASLRPRVIVLQIGINNVSADDTPADIAAGIEAIVDELLTTQPRSHVLICGPFPAGRTTDAPARRKVADIHAHLRRWPREELVSHLDLTALFVAADGSPRPTMAGDHLHISESGRDAWLAAISRALRRLTN